MLLDISGIERIGDQTKVKSEDIVSEFRKTVDYYKNSRLDLEDMWYSYYTNYLTTAASKQVNIGNAARFIGNIKKTWRHDLKAPVAYQTVETLVSYFQGAFFPNDRWFNVVPEQPIPDPQFNSIVELNRKYLSTKLSSSSFLDAVEIAVRNCCIAGTSAIMYPWVEDKVSFTPLCAFEFFLDPDNAKANEANLIRAYSLSKVETKHYVDTGLFNLAKREEVGEKPVSNEFYAQEIRRQLGMQESLRNNRINIYEFWGDFHLDEVILKNVRMSMTEDGQLLNLDSNPFYRRPFKVLTYLELGMIPYGIGALQPVASQIYYRDVCTSRNADNATIAADSVLLYRQDAIVSPDDLTIAPGKKIPVTDVNAIRPLDIPYKGGITIQEMAMADQMVDRAVGTGSFIGVDRGRNADRVTAEEVTAQRNAGGKRLSLIYGHLDRTFLVPLVADFHYYCQKFETQNTVVAYGDVYVGISPDTLKFPLKVISLGATNVADKENGLRNFLEWMQVVGSNEKFAAMVNWESILKTLTSMMIPHAGDDIISPPAPQQQQVPVNQLEEAMRFSQGETGVRTIQGQELAGQIPAAMQQQVQNVRGY